MKEKVEYRPCREGKEHEFFTNYFGDIICKYCLFAPEGQTSGEDLMIQLTKNCQTCGCLVEDHKLLSCKCGISCKCGKCNNPIFSE